MLPNYPDEFRNPRSQVISIGAERELMHGLFAGADFVPYGDTAIVNPTFGQVVAVGTATNALPALANIDPPRMFQFQVRFLF